jgi:hypothetical protein
MVVVAGSLEDALRISGTHGGQFDLLLAAVQVRGRYSDPAALRLGVLQPQMHTLLTSTLPLDLLIEEGYVSREERGSVGFLEKPYTASQLMKAVEEVMAKRPARTRTPPTPKIGRPKSVWNSK